jgi:secernin
MAKRLFTLVFILALFLSLLSSGSFPKNSHGKETEDNCTTIVLLPDATASGNLIIGKNRDLSTNSCQHIVAMPRKEYTLPQTVNLSKEVIPQEKSTYAWLGSQTWDSWGVGTGVNEFGVVIMINDASTGIKEKTAKGKGIEGDEMARLVLERCRSAEEAVKFIGNMVNEYGHGEGSCGQIYVIADPSEAWFFEGTTTQWVAEEIKSGIGVRANQFQIHDKWDLESKNVVNYAVEQGWSARQNFSFAEAYSEGWPMDHSQTRYERANHLLQPEKGELSKYDVMRVFRDHYEGTTHYENPPHYYSEYSNRTICVNRTVSSWVIELRPDYPKDISAQAWIASCSPCVSVYSPLYFCSSIPDPLLKGNDAYSSTSWWWRFKRIQQWVDEDYENRSIRVKELFSELERIEFEEVEKAEERYIKLLEEGKSAEAADFLSEFTWTCLYQIDVRVVELLSEAV